MDKLILIISIICFINSLFWLVADTTGNTFFKIIVKIVGIVGTVLPIIYWLKIANII